MNKASVQGHCVLFVTERRPSIASVSQARQVPACMGPDPSKDPRRWGADKTDANAGTEQDGQTGNVPFGGRRLTREVLTPLAFWRHEVAVWTSFMRKALAAASARKTSPELGKMWLAWAIAAMRPSLSSWDTVDCAILCRSTRISSCGGNEWVALKRMDQQHERTMTTCCRITSRSDWISHRYTILDLVAQGEDGETSGEVRSSGAAVTRKSRTSFRPSAHLWLFQLVDQHSPRLLTSGSSSSWNRWYRFELGPTSALTA